MPAAISVFITPRALITVRMDDFDIDALIAYWDLNAGLVGQNLPYPGFGHHSGFITSCIVIIDLAGGL